MITTIHKIHDLSNKHVADLLSTGLTEVDTNVQNYSPECRHINSNLFYILQNGRYNNGAYFVIEHNGEYVGSAGWNEYEYNSDIALILTRAYIVKKYRTEYLLSKILLPSILQEVTEYKHIWMTFNENNKSFYAAFSRLTLGKRPSIINSWPEVYRKFHPIGIKTIYYTDQYVVEYKK